MKEQLDRKQIQERAAEWLVRLEAEDDDPALRAQFAQWLRDSPVHVREYLAVSGTARNIGALLAHLPAGRLEALREQALAEPQEETIVELRPRAMPPARFPLAWLSASAAALAGIALLWFLLRVPAVEYVTLLGEQRTINLADGSILYVNSDSHVRVRFDREERQVTLERGQAAFRVMHEQRPFIVAADGSSVTAVGTYFDVYRNAGSLEVAVVEGRVNVRPSASASVAAVGAGQRAVIDSDRAGVRVDAAGARDALAWVDHQIVFEDQSLQAVVREFQRYSALTFDIQDADLRELRISGVFNCFDTAAFVRFLRRLDGVEVRESAQHVLIRRVIGAQAASQAST